MQDANHMIPKYAREVILEEREYQSHTIVLGRDKYQYMIGVKCPKSHSQAY